MSRSCSPSLPDRMLPAVKDGVAHINLAWTPDLVADHAGVTGVGLPETAQLPSGMRCPTRSSASAGRPCSPLGAATTTTGVPVVEGMLDLVHLDHARRTGR